MASMDEAWAATKLPDNDGGISSDSEDTAVNKSDKDMKEGEWVISHSRGNDCLHIIGHCGRKPGAHYKTWSKVTPGVARHMFKRLVDCAFLTDTRWKAAAN